MKPMNEQELDSLLNEIRGAEPSANEINEAKRRVLNQLQSGCAELQAALPEFINGSLPEQRQLLVQDHLGRCVACRRAFNQRGGNVVTAPVRVERKANKWIPFVIAACLAAGVTFAARGFIDRALAPSGPRAILFSSTGPVYRLQGDLPQEISAGTSVQDSEVIRTGAGARAKLKLTDGSLVEVSDRSQLFLTAAWSGQQIHLDRGDVIVEAAKQKRGELKVLTSDAAVAVKGTIFSVQTGSAGSLVTVVEGSVAVDAAGKNQLLKPSQQAATSESLQQISPTDAIAWSENSAKYLNLLAELAAIEKQVSDSFQSRSRSTSGIANMIPADALAFGAAPNVTGAVEQTIRLLDERSRQSAVLSQWWSDQGIQQGRRGFEELTSISGLLGEEIGCVALASDSSLSGPPQVALIAETQPAKLNELKQKLDALQLKQPDFSYTMMGSYLLAAPRQYLTSVQARLANASTNPFRQDILARYARGTNWIGAINASEIRRVNNNLSGAANVSRFFVEQRQVGSASENEATLAFDGNRVGIASWLANPGASGSAEYAAADALAVMSVMTKNPRLMLQDLEQLSKPGAGETSSPMWAFVQDLANALGTDYTISLERLTLPVPQVLLAADLTSPSRLESLLSQSIPNVTIRKEQTNGKSWYEISPSVQEQVKLSLWLTIDQGHALIGTSKDLLVTAIATKNTGSSLVRSAKFRGQTAGGGVHQSGFVWMASDQGAADALKLLKDQSLLMTQVQQLLANREPVLITLTGDRERITLSSRTRITSMLFDFLMMSGRLESGTAVR
jgi:hypothetical protein